MRSASMWAANGSNGQRSILNFLCGGGRWLCVTTIHKDLACIRHTQAGDGCSLSGRPGRGEPRPGRLFALEKRGMRMRQIGNLVMHPG